MPKFLVTATQTITLRGVVEADSIEEIHEMDLEEVDLTEIDNGSPIVETISKEQ